MRISTLHTALILVVLSVGYGLFQARELIGGPVLTVLNPHENALLEQKLLTVHGKTEHVVLLRINGRSVPISRDGYFEETLVTPSGLAMVHVDAQDRFGRTDERYITFYGRPDTTGQATTTAMYTTY